jgi:hypothetical protein
LSTAARALVSTLVLSVCACRLDTQGLGTVEGFGDASSDSSSADASVEPDTSVVADTFVPDTFVEPDTFAPADTSVEDAGPDVVDSAKPCEGTSFGGHCYFGIAMASTFDAAKAACASTGAHLASITSAAEQGIVGAIGSGDRWIGLVKDAGTPVEKASFRWITGESTASYDNWSPGDPNGGHLCARMLASGQWGDNPCTNAFAVVCERE